MKNLILLATTTAILSSALLTSGVAQAKQPSVGNAAVEWCVRVGPIEVCRDDGKDIGKGINANDKFKFDNGGLIQPKIINPKTIIPGMKGQQIMPNR